MKQTKSLFCLIMWMLWAFPALAQDAIPSNNSEDAQARDAVQYEANGGVLPDAEFLNSNKGTVPQDRLDANEDARQGDAEADGALPLKTGALQAQSDGAENPQMSASDEQNTEVRDAPEGVEVPVTDGDSGLQDESNDYGGRTPYFVGWNEGFKFYFGLGPVLDMEEIEFGYTARLGLDVHLDYFGIGLEVTWSMIWGTNAQKVTDLFNKAYRKTNSSFILMLNGYIPVNDHFIFSLGGGAGLGRRYVTVFADDKVKDSGISWLARAQVGFIWRCDNDLTISVDFAFDFGNYVLASKHPSLIGLGTDNTFGLALGLGYLAVLSHEEIDCDDCAGSSWGDDDD